MPILHQSLQFIDVTVLLFAGLLVSGSDCPLSCLYCISRFTSLIVTVFLSAGFRKYRAQIAPLFKVYRVNIAPHYLFTLKKLLITENCTKFVCLSDLFSPRLSISKDI